MVSERLGRSLGLVFLLSTGCSLGSPKLETCTQSSDCRDAFGFGWECGSTGYCSPLTVPDRCTMVFPEDLYERSDEHSDILLFGTLFNHQTDLANLRSVELAFFEANVEGGLEDREVGLVSCRYEADVQLDNDTEEIAAVSGATWLAEEVGVVGLIGPAASQLVVEIWPVVEENELFVISPSATSDELIAIDGALSTDEDPGLFWRTAPVDSNQAAAIALDVQRRGHSTVAVINQGGAYGDGLASLLQPALSIPASRMFSFENPNQLTAAIADVGLLAGLEEVVFISSDAGDIISFLNGANQIAGYDELSIFLTDTARSSEVLMGAAIASSLFPNIRGTNPIPDPMSAPQVDFYLAYSARYGENAGGDSFNAFAYDAAWLALYSTAWSMHQEGGISGRGIASGMRKVSAGPTIPLRAASWLEVVDLFADGQSINVAGASGDLDYDPILGETTAPLAVWVVNGAGDDFVDDQICYPGANSCLPAL